jgi:hypothetical protein
VIYLKKDDFICFFVILIKQNKTKVSLIVPSGPVKPGARVTLGKPAPADFPVVLNPKKKVWESASPHLSVIESNGAFVTVYNSEPLVCEGGIKLISTSSGSVG